MNYPKGSADPIFFLHIYINWVKIRLHAENQLTRLSGSALKVSVDGGGGVRWGAVGWWIPLNYVVTPTSYWVGSWAVTIVSDQPSLKMSTSSPSMSVSPLS